MLEIHHAAFTPAELQYLEANKALGTARRATDADPAWVAAAHEDHDAALAALRAECNDRVAVRVMGAGL